MRKDSVASRIDGAASASAESMRLRANTISYIDPSILNNFLASHDASLAMSGEDHPGHSCRTSSSGLNDSDTFGYRDMSASIGNHSQHHALPKLDVHLGLGLGGGLQTAPSRECGSDELELEKFFDSSGSIIDPNQLHYLKENTANPQSPFPGPFSNLFAGTPQRKMISVGEQV
jgi:hypothetical protein